jgi:cytochrome c
MKNLACTGAALATLLLFSACGGEQPSSEDTTATATPEASEAPATQAPAAPPAAFMQCRSCHSVEPGKNGVGPSLAGVFGKPAAGAPGFRYSDALRNSGITWTPEKLDEWLTGPMKMVPGTRMVQMVRDEEQRKAIIDYLATLQ